MQLHTDHLAYLIHLEQGLKTEFFSALSATKKKIVMDLAEAKLVWIDEANRINIHGHVNDVLKHVSTEFHKVATALNPEKQENPNGETK